MNLGALEPWNIGATFLLLFFFQLRFFCNCGFLGFENDLIGAINGYFTGTAVEEVLKQHLNFMIQGGFACNSVADFRRYKRGKVCVPV